MKPEETAKAAALIALITGLAVEPAVSKTSEVRIPPNTFTEQQQADDLGTLRIRQKAVEDK